MTADTAAQFALCFRAHDAFRGFIVYLARYRHCFVCFFFLRSMPFYRTFSVICHFG